MDVDPDEEARFKAALATLTPEEIQRRLDDNSIMRDWKRILAHGEVARRAQTAEADQRRSAQDAESLRLVQRQAKQKVWALVALAIVASVAVIWYLVPR